MKIYRMKATFGKLEHAELTLEPGLNIIQAPNEWGKSTWCAFLLTMLYGMDTRAKTTKTALAEKEKYAPWSGSPMEGRIDLNWDGRDITIERRTKGRTPFGVFAAYETDTGLEVPELTASNCGQMLLGVERSVFAKAGFLRLDDLPVTQDDALRRRLNALVTTGDESGAGDVLAGKLRDLKNRCRYNRTGLLPQAEAELAQLRNKQQELQSYTQQLEACQQHQTQLAQTLQQLENHRQALEYAKSQADAEHLRKAQEARDAALRQLEKWDEKCGTLPQRDVAQGNLSKAQTLQQQWMSLQLQSQALPASPEEPEFPVEFRGIPLEQMEETAKKHAQEYERLQKEARRGSVLPWLLLIAGVVLGGGLCAYLLWLGIAVAAVFAVAAAGVWVWDSRHRRAAKQAADALAALYHRPDPAQWVQLAKSYVNSMAAYRTAMTQYKASREGVDAQSEQLRLQMQALTQGQDLQIYTTQWQRVLSVLDAREQARRDYAQAENTLSSIRGMVKIVSPPLFPDELTDSMELTLQKISQCEYRQGQLQLQMGEYRGKMAAIGEGKELEEQITALQQRIDKLEQTYAALELAQRTLSDATAELQRRFAPQISARAQAIFGQLTDGRYDRMTLTQELAVNAGAEGEDTLRSVQWRSAGTADQLYVALRLAVAEELTPWAPLVLDDVLVRFDDRRLQNAVKLLADVAKSRQVILFTCQGRETEAYRACQ